MARSSLQIEIDSEVDTAGFGERLAKAISTQLNSDTRAKALILYLQGDLGAGKTTLARSIVQAFGHSRAVKSPTYTLVEPYELEALNIYHFDLYRLVDPEELLFLGVDDYFSGGDNLCMIEWPSRGEGFLPSADLQVSLSNPSEEVNDPDISNPNARILSMCAYTERGCLVLDGMAAAKKKL